LYVLLSLKYRVYHPKLKKTPAHSLHPSVKRAKNITWSVPQDWAAGDYILRAFGNGSYPCKENGHRVFCQFPLEDRETVHLHALPVGQSCPPSLVPSSSEVLSLSSSESVPSSSSTEGSGKEETQIESKNEDGYSTPLQIHIDPSVLALLQQQNEANTRHDNSSSASVNGAGVYFTKTTTPTGSVVDSNQGRVQEKKTTQANGALKDARTSVLTIAGTIMVLLVAW